jgi:hypothetical protein
MTTETFVKVDENQKWIYRAMVGSKTKQNIDIQFAGIGKLKRKAQLRDDGNADSGDDHEPLGDSMTLLAPVHAPPAKKRKKRADAPERRKDTIYTVVMPTRFDANLDATETQHIRVYIDKARSGSLWISVHDVTWLLEYLRSEAESRPGGGRHDPCDDDDGVDEENGRSDVPSGVRVEFCFNKHEWLAVVTAKEHALNGKTYTASAATMTLNKWNEAGDLYKTYGAFNESSFAQRHEAARDWLIAHVRNRMKQL